MVSLPLICVSKKFGFFFMPIFYMLASGSFAYNFFFFFFLGGGVPSTLKYYLFYCTASGRLVIISDAMHND